VRTSGPGEGGDSILGGQRMSGYGFTLSTKIKVLKKGENHCWYCGLKLALDSMTIDHIIPVAQHGNARIDNLVPACKTCNSAKGGKTLEDYRWSRRQKKSHWAQQGIYFSACQQRYLQSINLALPDPPNHIFWFETQGAST